jgi:hypothetical protein
MAYSRGQREYLVTRFYGTRRKCRLKVEYRKASSKCAVNRLLNKFQKTGRVIDNKMSVGGKKYVSTPGNVHHVEQALRKSPRKHVKCPSEERSLRASSALDN